jgi:hypothetical protein
VAQRSQLWAKCVAAAGYSSVEEFVAHCVENELKKHASG